MEKIEEIKKKLQCEKCHEPYNSKHSAWLHNKCGHHTCAFCLKSLIEHGIRICPICDRETPVVVVPFLYDVCAFLDSCKLNGPREDDQKCIECGKSDSEQDMQLCETCHELKFENVEDVKKNALCSTCAIKKHMRKGHQTVDFYPYLSAYNFSSKSSEIDAKLDEFKNAQVSLENTFSYFKDISINVSENFDVLTDMARRSKNTKNQVEFIEKMETFIDESKSINIRADSDMKKHATELEGNLAEIKKWYESKMGNCVDESEIIKLPKPENSQEDIVEIDA